MIYVDAAAAAAAPDKTDYAVIGGVAGGAAVVLILVGYVVYKRLEAIRNDNEKRMVGTFQGKDISGMTAAELMQVIYDALDTDGDGDVSKEELKALDTDGDGVITKEELLAFAAKYENDREKKERKASKRASKKGNDGGYLDVSAAGAPSTEASKKKSADGAQKKK